LREKLIADKKVVVAGGDARDIVLARSLQEMGANVWLYGFTELAEEVTAGLQAGLPAWADVLICPLPGVDKDGFVFTRCAKTELHISQVAHLFRPGLLILAGRMPEKIRLQMEALRTVVVLTADLDELAILNAVPTAEGAVELAMRESKITISGSKALVTGFGRCGQTLATLLKAMGADVTVAARRREVLALAESMRFVVIELEQLAGVVEKFNFIFNTVPAMVLSEDILSRVNPESVIIDIASSPGGTDFYAAERLGLKSFLALGLPGKVAPVSAGRILAKVYPYLINAHRKGGKQHEA
jgi:dipicolinate synthase subunit A